MPSRRPVLGAFAALGLLWGAWAALVPSVQAAVGISKGQLGLALLFVGLGSVPAMASVGFFVDRFGAVVLPASLAALALTAVLPALAGSLAGLAAALFVLGAASGMVDVAMNSEVAALEAATRRTFMPLAHALFSIGVIAGAVSAGVARQLGAGRTSVFVGVAVLVAATAWWNRRPYPRLGEARPGRRRIRARFAALGLVCALAFLIEGGIENWSALFLERDLGAAPAVSALGPGAYAVAMVAGRLSGQWLHSRARDTVVLGAGGLVSVGGLLAASQAGSAPLAIVSFFVAGAGVSVAAPILFGAAGRGATDADRGSAVATVTTIGYLGFLAGPPIVGAVAQSLGLRASFLVLAGVAACVAAATPRLALDET
jgi:predicted MFS family arabinose efflux permease